MIRSVTVLCALAATASAIPLIPAETPIPVLEEVREDPDSEGNYTYFYRTGNGIGVEVFGYMDKDTKIHNAHGRYQYTAPNGEIVNVIYHANHRGFQVLGSHIAPEIIENAFRGTD